MNGIDSYLVISTDREAYALGSVTNKGWFRLDNDGKPVGRPLKYREIERRWVSLDYSHTWKEAKRNLDRRRESITRNNLRRLWNTGTLTVCYEPTITVRTFFGIISTVRENTGIPIAKMLFGPRALIVHNVCAEDYEATGCALANLVSRDVITDISWTGKVTE